MAWPIELSLGIGVRHSRCHIVLEVVRHAQNQGTFPIYLNFGFLPFPPVTGLNNSSAAVRIIDDTLSMMLLGQHASFHAAGRSKKGVFSVVMTKTQCSSCEMMKGVSVTCCRCWTLIISVEFLTLLPYLVVDLNVTLAKLRHFWMAVRVTFKVWTVVTARPVLLSHITSVMKLSMHQQSLKVSLLMFCYHLIDIMLQLSCLYFIVVMTDVCFILVFNLYVVWDRRSK